MSLSILFLFALFVLAYNALFSFSYSYGPNYRNVSVDTRVNITSGAPTIMSVSMPNPLTLTAGTTTDVQCNVTVRHFNGVGFINSTNATLYHSTSAANATDNNNTHYTNPNCTFVSGAGIYANYTCNFSVYYYALNGTWTCNASVQDITGFNDTRTNATNFSVVLALNVTPLIDYGNLAVGGTSENFTADITNIGNAGINLSVKGYGATPGDGLAFACQSGNISVANERFSIDPSHGYAQKTPLSSTFQNVTNFTINRQNDTTLRTNTTYWQIYVPPNPFGQCNGTIVFQAELS